MNYDKEVTEDDVDFLNDHSTEIKDAILDDTEFSDIAEMNIECKRNGGVWYPHLVDPSQAMKDMGVVMPGGV